MSMYSLCSRLPARLQTLSSLHLASLAMTAENGTGEEGERRPLEWKGQGGK